jgi:hypothetical protein
MGDVGKISHIDGLGLVQFSPARGLQPGNAESEQNNTENVDEFTHIFVNL